MNKRRRVSLTVLSVCALCILGGARLLLLTASVPGAAAQQGAAGAERFGIIGAASAEQAARDLGVGWERITFDWAAIQPHGPDDFETEPVNEALAAALADDREVVGLIVHTPPWASESGRPSAVPEGLNLPLDDPGNVWAAFITRLVEEYAPRGVHRWIIYDEPDVRRGEGHQQFEGDVQAYADLLKTAYRAAKAADPQAMIHLAGMNWWVEVAAGREPYLARLLRVLQSDPEAAEAGAYFDVVTLRLYNDTQAIIDVITVVRRILDGAGLADKPIWLETNASPASEEGRPPLFNITPPMQADFIAQVTALSLALGVERIAVYRLADSPDDHQPWGLLHADGEPRPAYEAYRQAIRLFGPTLTAARFEHAYGELLMLEQADQTVFVMWASKNVPVQFVITSPAVGERAQLLTALGEASEVEAIQEEYPAAFVVDAPAAFMDRRGFLTVAGSPRFLVVDRNDDFYRVVYLWVNGERFRLR